MELKNSVQIKHKDIDTIELVVFDKMKLVVDFHTYQNNLDRGCLAFFKSVSNMSDVILQGCKTSRVPK